MYIGAKTVVRTVYGRAFRHFTNQKSGTTVSKNYLWLHSKAKQTLIFIASQCLCQSSSDVNNNSVQPVAMGTERLNSSPASACPAYCQWEQYCCHTAANVNANVTLHKSTLRQPRLQLAKPVARIVEYHMLWVLVMTAGVVADSVGCCCWRLWHNLILILTPFTANISQMIGRLF